MGVTGTLDVAEERERAETLARQRLAEIAPQLGSATGWLVARLFDVVGEGHCFRTFSAEAAWAHVLAGALVLPWVP